MTLRPYSNPRGVSQVSPLTQAALTFFPLFVSFLSQVGVTVLEAQKLVGVNINPYVAVCVGDQRRVTATLRGTNCPFYNEVRRHRRRGWV